MATFNSSLEFFYEDEEGHPNRTLWFTYNDDGTATLKRPICKDRQVIFDQSVVKYLEEIKADLKKYTFIYSEKIWYINHLPISNTSGYYAAGFVSGDVIDDGKKIICTNPIPLIATAQ